MSVWRLEFVCLEAIVCLSGGYSLSVWRLKFVCLEARVCLKTIVCLEVTLLASYFVRGYFIWRLLCNVRGFFVWRLLFLEATLLEAILYRGFFVQRILWNVRAFLEASLYIRATLYRCTLLEATFSEATQLHSISEKQYFLVVLFIFFCQRFGGYLPPS